MMRTFLAGNAGSLVACALLAAQTSQAPASVRPRPGRPACRIYATSATETTTNGPIKSVMTTKTRFDARAAKLTVDATFSASQGTRFTIQSVSEFASVADFVNEVVRSSGGSGISTAGRTTLAVGSSLFEAGDVGRGLYTSSGWADRYRLVTSLAPRTVLGVSGAPATSSQARAFWSVNTVPPISLIRTNTISGDQHAVMTNAFNAAGAVVKSEQKQSTGTDTTTYTAWDPFGRPTAGTIVTTTPTRSVVTIAYDDLQRTSTWRGTHDGITNVVTRYFDENGVPVKQINDKATTIIDNHEFDMQCAGPVHQPPPLPSGTSARPVAVRGPRGAFTATIDAAGWTAKQGVSGSYREMQIGDKTVPLVAVAGSNEDYTIALSVLVTDGIGDYTTDIDPSIQPPLTPAQEARGVADIEMTAAKGPMWTSAPATKPGPGYGLIRITALSPTSVSGTFTVALVPLPGSGAAGPRVVGGTFSIQF